MPVPAPLVPVAQWCLDVITASHVGGYLEPGKVRRLSGEEARHGLNEDLIGRNRRVSLSDRIRSTHRLPLALAVPKERLRHRTPKRKARSADYLWALRHAASRNIERAHPVGAHVAED